MELAESEIDQLFDLIDHDKNGTISYTEFLTHNLN